MPETNTTGGATGKGFGFLGNKVGPLPLWVWIAAGIVIYYYLGKKNTSAKTAAGANQQTDPAGNIGSIDPSTGYVYGTPEDTAALAANNGTSGSSGSGGSSSGGAQPGQQSYTDNNSWGRAAVNYLVSIGVDPTQATQAIQLYLSSQPVNVQQQAIVNEAIQALGAPPSLPGPSSSNPGSVGGGGSGGGGGGGGKGGGGGGGQKPVAPKNLHVANNTGKGVQIVWDLPGGVKTSNAGWRVENHTGGSSGPLVDSFTTQNTIANLGGALVHGGLKHGGHYTARVSENVKGAPWGSVSYVAK